MKNLKNYKKATSLVAKYSEKTAISKAKNENAEVLEIVQKIIERSKKPTEITVKDFCRELVKNRLQKIAKAMPDEGYSMGSNIRIGFNTVIENDDRTQEYSKSCKYRPTHGGYFLKLTLNELKNIHVIGGLVTYIEPGQKSKVKKCWWYSGSGSKNRWELVKKHGYIFAGFHHELKDWALAGGLRNIENKKQSEKRAKIEALTEKQKAKKFAAALRKQYTYQDSLNAGNCEIGTKAFILRCGLDISKKYRGKFLLETAKEKSTSSVYYVEKMIKSKM